MERRASDGVFLGRQFGQALRRLLVAVGCCMALSVPFAQSVFSAPPAMTAAQAKMVIGEMELRQGFGLPSTKAELALYQDAQRVNTGDRALRTPVINRGGTVTTNTGLLDRGSIPLINQDGSVISPEAYQEMNEALRSDGRNSLTRTGELLRAARDQHGRVELHPNSPQAVEAAVTSAETAQTHAQRVVSASTEAARLAGDSDVKEFFDGRTRAAKAQLNQAKDIYGGANQRVQQIRELEDARTAGQAVSSGSEAGLGRGIQGSQPTLGRRIVGALSAAIRKAWHNQGGFVNDRLFVEDDVGVDTERPFIANGGRRGFDHMDPNMSAEDRAQMQAYEGARLRLRFGVARRRSASDSSGLSLMPWFPDIYEDFYGEPIEADLLRAEQRALARRGSATNPNGIQSNPVRQAKVQAPPTDNDTPPYSNQNQCSCEAEYAPSADDLQLEGDSYSTQDPALSGGGSDEFSGW